MIWAQVKDPVCYLCLSGSVVASWSPTQEVADLNPCTELILFNYFILTTNHTNSSEIRLKQNKYGELHQIILTDILSYC